MSNATANASDYSTIGKPYGRDSRIATAKEMAMADVVGSDCGNIRVEKGTMQVWKWADHFQVFVTMAGWNHGKIKSRPDTLFGETFYAED